jgi:hypothetical protein
MAATKKSKTAVKKTATAAKVKIVASKAKKASGGKSVASKASKKTSSKKLAAASKKAVASKSSKAKASGASKASKKAAASKGSKAKQARDVLDFSGLPAAYVSRGDVTLCLACIFRLFTNQLGLAPRTAYDEIRRYSPTVEELTERALPLLRRRAALARARRGLPRRGRQGFGRGAPRARQGPADEGRALPDRRAEEDRPPGLLRVARKARAGPGLRGRGRVAARGRARLP